MLIRFICLCNTTVCSTSFCCVLAWRKVAGVPKHFPCISITSRTATARIQAWCSQCSEPTAGGRYFNNALFSYAVALHTRLCGWESSCTYSCETQWLLVWKKLVKWIWGLLELKQFFMTTEFHYCDQKSLQLYPILNNISHGADQETFRRYTTHILHIRRL